MIGSSIAVEAGEAGDHLRRVAAKHKGIIAAITLVIFIGIALASHYGAAYNWGNTVPYGRTSAPTCT